MAVLQLELSLNALLSKNSIDEDDVKAYLKSLATLTKAIKKENRFQAYAPIVKQWIGSYETIFREAKLDEKALKYLYNTCGVMTEIFFMFMPSFNQLDPDYSQEFFIHWKLILSRMKGKKRAQVFVRHIKHFKTLVEYMRTAKQRCEQLAILDVIKLYIERASSTELANLKELYNQDVIDKLIAMNRMPAVWNRHEFLHDINAMGRNIVSLKPTKIICEELSMNFNISSHTLYIDFNLRDNSIIFVAVPLIGKEDKCFCVVTAPKLKEKLCEEHVMNIRGTWSIMTTGDPFRMKSNVTVFLPIYDRNAMWKAKVRSVFSFVPETKIFSESASQDSQSIMTDQRLKHALDESFVANHSNWSQKDESDAGSSIMSFQDDTSSLVQLLETSMAPPIRQRANEQLVPPIQQELHRSQQNYDKILTQRNYSVGDGKRDLYFNDAIDLDERRTDIIEKSITPIAKKQLDNDIENVQQHFSQKADKSYDLKEAKQSYEVITKPVNNKYLNGDVSDVPITPHFIEDDGQSSGVSFGNDMSIVGEGSYNDANENDDYKDNNQSNGKLPVGGGRKLHDVDMTTKDVLRRKSFDSPLHFSQKGRDKSSDISEESFSPIQTQKLNEAVTRFLQQTDSDLSSDEIQLRYAKTVDTYNQLNNSIQAIIGMNSPTLNSSQNPSRKAAFAKASQRNSSQNQHDIFARQRHSTPERYFKMLSPPVRKIGQTKIEKKKSSGQLNESIDAFGFKTPTRSSSQKQSDSVLRQSAQDASETYFEKINSPIKKPSKVEILRVDVIVEPNETSTVGMNVRPRLQEDIELIVNPPILAAQEPHNLPPEVDEIMNNVDATDGHEVYVRIDNDGMVYDVNGCVFVNDEELEYAWEVYIESNGLDYLNSDRFKSLSAEGRARMEREFRTIHSIMHRGYYVQRDEMEYDDDSYVHSEQSVRTDRGTTKRKIRSVDSPDKDKPSTKSPQDLKKRKEESLNESSGTEMPLKNSNDSANLSQHKESVNISPPPKPAHHSQANEEIRQSQLITETAENPSNSGSPKKLPIYASEKMKIITQPHSLPSIVNVEEVNPTTDNLVALHTTDNPKGHAVLEENSKNDNVAFGYQIEQCNDVRCGFVSLVHQLDNLTKNPEICDYHRGIFMKFVDKLQTIQTENQLQMNSVNNHLVEICKNTVGAIKSICQNLSLDVAKLSNRANAVK